MEKWNCWQENAKFFPDWETEKYRSESESTHDIL